MNIEKFNQELKQFPPILRKIAVQIAKDPEIKPLNHIAKSIGITPRYVHDSIYQLKKKNKDFHKFLDEIYRDKLVPYRPVAYMNLLKQVQKGSFKHLELFFRLTGDLKENKSGDASTTINNLTFVLPMPASIEETTPKAITVEHTNTTVSLEDGPLPEESDE